MDWRWSLLPPASEFLDEFQSALADFPLPEEFSRRYRLDSALGHREEGSSWLVRRKEDGALLVLRRSAGNTDLAEEFRLLSALPEDMAGRVPQPVEFFEEDGVQYLLRTYLPGRPLDEAWEAEPFSLRRWVRIGQSLCALLERLHRLDPPIVHRDVKPENIILSPEGEPGLIDFDIARSYKPEQETDTVFMGTRATAAPEQYGFSQTDQRTDLYALGVTLRWMVTGSYDPAALERAACPGWVKRFLRKATAFSPSDRYASAGAMAAALRRGGAPRWKKLGAAALALCLLCLSGWGLLAASRARTVEFSSVQLEEAVRAELGKAEGPIAYRDLHQIRRLALVGRQVMGREQDYQYRLLGYLDGVSQMEMPYGDVSDLTLLADMPNLNELYLCQQNVSDLSPLAGLPLRQVYLCDNQITDLSPLAGCPDIETLYVGTNPIADLTPLASLAGLRELNLDNYTFNWQVDSLAPLAELPLRVLSVGNILPADGDWTALGRMEELERLWLWDPSAEAVQALADCAALRYLHLGNYRYGDLSGLPVMPALEDLSTYSRLPSLAGIEKQRGLIWVNLCNLPDVSLAPLASLEKLTNLTVFGCRFSDFGPLKDAPSLLQVELEESSRAAFEATCPDHGFQVKFS